MGEVHANNIAPGCVSSVPSTFEHLSAAPFRSIVILSGELVFGPRAKVVSRLSLSSTQIGLTDRADDRSPAIVPLWREIYVEIAAPFQLGAVGEMVQSVTHDGGIFIW